MVKKQALWLVPLSLLIIITPFTPYLDLAISHYFYEGGRNFASNSFYDFIYEYGFMPGDAFALIAFLLLILSFFLRFGSVGAPTLWSLCSVWYWVPDSLSMWL